jgi:hypothetical protein
LTSAPSTSAPLTSAGAIAVIEAASGPDELFGSDAARAYRRLAQLTHPDAHPGDRRAADAFAKLAALWRQHQASSGVLVARGVARHGSCGMGIGETARYALENPGDAPRVADCVAPRTLARKLARLRDQVADELGPLGAPVVLRSYGPTAADKRLAEPRLLAGIPAVR